MTWFSRFLSTHPSRSATPLSLMIGPSGSLFLSTHPSRSATDVFIMFSSCHIVSIHAPLAECDGLTASIGLIMQVSIHAPLAECDLL